MIGPISWTSSRTRWRLEEANWRSIEPDCRGFQKGNNDPDGRPAKATRGYSFLSRLISEKLGNSKVVSGQSEELAEEKKAQITERFEKSVDRTRDGTGKWVDWDFDPMYCSLM